MTTLLSLAIILLIGGSALAAPVSNRVASLTQLRACLEASTQDANRCILAGGDYDADAEIGGTLVIDTPEPTAPSRVVWSCDGARIFGTSDPVVRLQVGGSEVYVELSGSCTFHNTAGKRAFMLGDGGGTATGRVFMTDWDFLSGSTISAPAFADSATSNTLVDVGVHLVAGEWVKIIAGRGRDQVRRITSKATPDQIQVNPNWQVIPDSSSEYIISEGPAADLRPTAGRVTIRDVMVDGGMSVFASGKIEVYDSQFSDQNANHLPCLMLRGTPEVSVTGVGWASENAKCRNGISIDSLFGQVRSALLHGPTILGGLEQGNNGIYHVEGDRIDTMSRVFSLVAGNRLTADVRIAATAGDKLFGATAGASFGSAFVMVRGAQADTWAEGDFFEATAATALNTLTGRIEQPGNAKSWRILSDATAGAFARPSIGKAEGFLAVLPGNTVEACDGLVSIAGSAGLYIASAPNFPFVGFATHDALAGQPVLFASQGLVTNCDTATGTLTGAQPGNVVFLNDPLVATGDLALTPPHAQMAKVGKIIRADATQGEVLFFGFVDAGRETLLSLDFSRDTGIVGSDEWVLEADPANTVLQRIRCQVQGTGSPSVTVRVCRGRDLGDDTCATQIVASLVCDDTPVNITSSLGANLDGNEPVSILVTAVNGTPTRLILSGFGARITTPANCGGIACP